MSEAGDKASRNGGYLAVPHELAACSALSFAARLGLAIVEDLLEWRVREPGRAVAVTVREVGRRLGVGSGGGARVLDELRKAGLLELDVKRQWQRTGRALTTVSAHNGERSRRRARRAHVGERRALMPVSANTQEHQEHQEQGQAALFEGGPTSGAKGRNGKRLAGDVWGEACAAMHNGALMTPGFEAAWRTWVKDRKDRRKSLTPAAITRQIRELEAMGEAAAIASIEQSVRNGWTGLFPPKDDGGPGRRAGRPARASIASDEYYTRGSAP